MYKKQKRVFISILLAYGGLSIMLIMLILIYVYIEILNEIYGDFLSIIGIFILILSLIFMISAQRFNPMFSTRAFTFHTGLIEGVPNNHKNQFTIKKQQLLNINEIFLYENEKGVFCTGDGLLNLKFDMRYWVRKKFYIYEYILTCLQLEYSKKLYKKAYIKNISNLDIIFIYKNKQKRINLIHNNWTHRHHQAAPNRRADLLLHRYGA